MANVSKQYQFLHKMKYNSLGPETLKTGQVQIPILSKIDRQQLTITDTNLKFVICTEAANCT